MEVIGGSEKAANTVVARGRSEVGAPSVEACRDRLGAPGTPDPPSHRRGHWFEPSIAHSKNRRSERGHGTSRVPALLISASEARESRLTRATALRDVDTANRDDDDEEADEGWSRDL